MDALWIQVEGQRPPNEIFEDMAEVIGGILQRTISIDPTDETQIPQNSQNAPEAEDRQISAESKHAEVVIHDLSETGSQKSIDSVDAMIEEEMSNSRPRPDPESAPSRHSGNSVISRRLN